MKMNENEEWNTFIGCIDDRCAGVALPLIKGLRVEDKSTVKRLDLVTWEGLPKYLAEPEKPEHKDAVKFIMDKIDISYKNHGSRRFWVAGHEDCAANEVSEKEHIEQERKACEFLKSKYPDCDIYGLHFDEKEQAVCHTHDDMNAKLNPAEKAPRALFLTLAERFGEVLKRLLPETPNKAELKQKREMLLYRMNADMASADMSFKCVEYGEDEKVKEMFWGDHKRYINSLSQSVTEFSKLYGKNMPDLNMELGR
jgi:hypothetical protein